ncbi:serine hydrolase domain-containing protein [Lutimaribacter saemankumensis]|uniref:CubicO group peptidase, beta-lactamase class C family n=1 Tax=Lutimaribacter saemankumensis TaxID=490829 RepID=A0A1G8K8E0_9RHOB|nr:serine hydrolase domain-containing protein [Lutimaribacter saemankumensis]SDI39746.1 CubicO group peptidase, beta-lactamase class C family [Lutimaribacter saemankumensis]
MRNSFIAAGFVVLTVAASVSQPTLPHADEHKGLVERLTQVVPQRMERDDVAGAVMVLIEDGNPVWTKAFGMADPTTGRLMSADALFRVESIAKPVTAWGAMRLAEKGLFDLDAPIDECLKRWRLPAAVEQITPRLLLSHSAGVGLGDFTSRFPPEASRPSLPEHLEQTFALIAPPGSGFSYSDTGFNLLELAIEDCTNEDFGALMIREILKPLEMTAASFDWTGAPMPLGHDLHGRQVIPYVYPGRASGGLYTTASDIARFAAASMNGSDQSVLSAESRAALYRPVVKVKGLFGFAADSYGLGHFIEALSDGREAVWHGGQGYGWMSHMHLIPETGDGIVILSNSQRAWPLFATILRDWSNSLDIAPVGMARVLWAEIIARGFIALAVAIAALSVWLAFRVKTCPAVVKVSAGIIAVPLTIWPIWAFAQDYLFLFSILPGLWPWLGAASILAGTGLVSLVLLPRGSKQNLSIKK